MKKLIIAALAASTIATPAFAQTANSSESFQIQASVADSCVMADINTLNLGQQDIFTTSASGENALRIESADTDTTNNFLLACNDTHRLSIRSENSGLRNFDRPKGADDDASFTDIIEYRLSLQNYNHTANLNTFVAGDPGFNMFVSGLIGARHRNVNIKVDVLPEDNTGRPLAGNYRDNVTVEVTSI